MVGALEKLKARVRAPERAALEGCCEQCAYPYSSFRSMGHQTCSVKGQRASISALRARWPLSQPLSPAMVT